MLKQSTVFGPLMVVLTTPKVVDVIGRITRIYNLYHLSNNLDGIILIGPLKVSKASEDGL